MELFSFDVQGRHFAVVLDFDLRLERLIIDQTVMSVKPLGEATSVHVFEDGRLGRFQLSFTLNPQAQSAHYQLQSDKAEPITGVAELSGPAKLMVSGTNEAKPSLGSGHKLNWIVLGGIAFKLLKTVKVVKAALIAASVAVYSVMFTVEFALALVAVLMFHEYGHVRAMKKFGIPTKGFYLIPFFGGIAVGDKAKTQWESLYISMMGPVYGLAMTAVFFVIYLITKSHFCGLLAATSALLNLFNLLPIHPLDGGQVVKALVFSRRNNIALFSFLGLSAVFLYAAWLFGFYFLCFFIVIGVVDIITNWSMPISVDMTPLKTYGIWFSLIWYLLVTLAFIAMIVLLVIAQVPGAEIATKILSS